MKKLLKRFRKEFRFWNMTSFSDWWFWKVTTHSNEFHKTLKDPVARARAHRLEELYDHS